jgi:predicted secreted protein
MQDLSKLILITATLGFCSLGAAQQDADVYDRVDLSANAESEIENDVLIAIVFAEVEANNQADAANRVNTAIQWALERARRVPEIELQTTQYSTRPVYANERRIVGWVARQGLRLESRDPAALSELLGALQERVAVQSVDYNLSKEARDTAEEALMAEALAGFNRRAALVAEQLGREGSRIVHINIGTSGGGPVRFAREALASADVAAPPLEAGTQTVSVFVTGTVELSSPR